MIVSYKQYQQPPLVLDWGCLVDLLLTVWQVFLECLSLFSFEEKTLINANISECGAVCLSGHESGVPSGITGHNLICSTASLHRRRPYQVDTKMLLCFLASALPLMRGSCCCEGEKNRQKETKHKDREWQCCRPKAGMPSPWPPAVSWLTTWKMDHSLRCYSFSAAQLSCFRHHKEYS